MGTIPIDLHTQLRTEGVVMKKTHIVVFVLAFVALGYMLVPVVLHTASNPALYLTTGDGKVTHVHLGSNR